MTTQTLEKNPVDVRAGDPQRHTAGKFLTFQLADEEFGIEILKVREINKVMDITAIPQMPAYMKGVINLRGNVIPVIDLRLKFGLPELAHTEQTCIIVVDVGRAIGILVDTVSEVLNIAADCIDPAPALHEVGDVTFILGMGKVGEAVKILLDIDRVLNSGELAALHALVNDPGATDPAAARTGGTADDESCRDGTAGRPGR
jgi:purine-binding chemotaxis protein CheW